jgi:hypothetical protein
MRLGDTALFVIIIVSLGVSIYYTIQSIELNNDYRIQNFRIEKSVQCENISLIEMIVTPYTIGASMLPTLSADSRLLIIEYNESRKLVEGDIISGDKTTHRIIGVYDDYVVTKGDNNIDIDSDFTNKTAIEYVVCGVMR